MDKKRRSLVVPSVALAVAMSSGLLCNLYSNNIANAADKQLTMAATIEPSMTLSIDNTSPKLNITPSSAGTFDSTSIWVEAVSNGHVGYTLTMVPSDTNLVGEITNTTIPTIPAGVSFECRGAEECNSENFAPGYWGIAEGPSKYHGISAMDLGTIDDANAEVSYVMHSIFLGANLDLSTAVDTYSTTIAFVATPVIKTYDVAFEFGSVITGVTIKDLNGDTVATVSESGESIALEYANTYVMEPSYVSGFSDSVAFLDGDGLINDDSTFTVGPSNSTISLYGKAVMQDVAEWKGSLSEEEQVVVVDNRDSNTYTAALMKDGNVWMTQNLDHNIVAGKTYTPADTDIPANWIPSTSTYATGVTTWNDPDNPTDSHDPDTSPESYDPGNLCWNGTIRNDYNGTLSNSTTACDSSNMNYSIGNYYNWTAAVAMNDSSSYTTENTDADQSICPAGWMLPKSGPVQTGSGSFGYLVDRQGLTGGTSGNIQNAPTYFTYGGHWSGGFGEFSSYGAYLSSVIENGGYSYTLSFISDWGVSSGGVPRYMGFSVRCVVR